MNDYIVLVDENGQPYIAHSIGKRAVKYIAKIGEGAKARYFYTKEQLNAFKNKARDKWDGGVSAKKAEQAYAEANKKRSERDSRREKYKNYDNKHWHLGKTAIVTSDAESATYDRLKNNVDKSEKAYREASSKAYMADRYAEAVYNRSLKKKLKDIESKAKEGSKVLAAMLVAGLGIATLPISYIMYGAAGGVDRILEKTKARYIQPGFEKFMDKVYEPTTEALDYLNNKRKRKK